MNVVVVEKNNTILLTGNIERGTLEKSGYEKFVLSVVHLRLRGKDVTGGIDMSGALFLPVLRGRQCLHVGRDCFVIL